MFLYKSFIFVLLLYLRFVDFLFFKIWVIVKYYFFVEDFEYRVIIININ